MHRHDRLSARRDRRLNRLRVDRPRLWLYVHHNGECPCGDRRVAGSGECERRDDHLVAPADAERLQCHFHCDGAVHHQDAVRASLPAVLIRRKGFAESRVVLARLWEAAPDAAAQHLQQDRLVFGVEVGPCGVRIRLDWTSPCDRELFCHLTLLCRMRHCFAYARRYLSGAPRPCGVAPCATYLRTPATLMPRAITRCAKAKMMTSGAKASALPARRRCHCRAKRVTKPARPTGRVVADGSCR